MFQTEFNHFLQLFHTPFIDEFMGLVSAMGYNSFLIMLAISIIIGYDLRKGFALMHLILFTGLISEILKSVFAYPRPVDVDSSLMKIGIENTGNSYGFLKMGAKGFFELLSPEVVNFFRNLSGYGHGIPSGHVAVTTTIWSAFSIFSGKKIVYYFSSFMIVLMAVSRMYLGRHFLADVTAGFAIGIVILMLFYYYFYRNGKFDEFFPLTVKINFGLLSTLKYIYFFIFPFGVILIPFAGIPLASYIIAINLAYVFFNNSGLPVFSNKFMNRVFRICISFVIFFFVKNTLDLAFPGDNSFLQFIKSFIPAFLMIYLTIKLSAKLKIAK